ncbi:hypothetical protein E2C01_009842 [Portunus trituberculatus]|uniref:Uncharacterized protein n=1 Tax=Portunus trituberculatus TaxID=210409 RepID=A0A5B7D6T1_PORTR|nr:hypothetical protein [Portunus trituberculatus]
MQVSNMSEVSPCLQNTSFMGAGVAVLEPPSRRPLPNHVTASPCHPSPPQPHSLALRWRLTEINGGAVVNLRQVAGRPILTALPPALASSRLLLRKVYLQQVVAEMADCKLSALNNNTLNTT